MRNREACERRVYRLAALLTGNTEAAAQVIEAVVGAQPDLRRLDSAHLDRLTVLRSREIKAKTLAGEAIPADVAAALASLSRQQREAWVFHYVYRLMPRDMARAMDCSVNAIRTHLESAEGAVAATIGRPHTETGKALLDFTMRLDVPEFYRAQQRRRRSWKMLRILFGVLLAAAVLTAIAIVLFRRVS